MSLGISRLARDQIVYLKTAGNLFASRAKQICIYIFLLLWARDVFMICSIP